MPIGKYTAQTSPVMDSDSRAVVPILSNVSLYLRDEQISWQKVGHKTNAT